MMPGRESRVLRFHSSATPTANGGRREKRPPASKSCADRSSGSQSGPRSSRVLTPVSPPICPGSRRAEEARKRRVAHVKKVLKKTWKKTKKPFSKKVANDKGTWKATIDSASGNTYYFHTKTRQTTWIKPTGFKEQ